MYRNVMSRETIRAETHVTKKENLLWKIDQKPRI